MAQDSQRNDLSFLLTTEAHVSPTRSTAVDLKKSPSMPSPAIPVTQARADIRSGISNAKREISRFQSLLTNKPFASTANFLIYTRALGLWRETLKSREEELVAFDSANVEAEVQVIATAPVTNIELSDHAIPALSPAGQARVDAFAEAARLARRKRIESAGAGQ